MAPSTQTDVLVIGMGIAGVITALEAANGGAEVTLIQRSLDETESNTFYAQGGIIYLGENDSADLLANDISEAGAGICDPASVRLVAETGPRLVKEILIDRLGVQFDRSPNGELDVTEEAAHATPRIIHSRDRVGEAISQRLVQAANDHKRIKVVRGAVAVDLLTLSHHSKDPLDIYAPPTCIGAYVFLRDAGCIETILARETVLATGGLGQLYLHTTNPRGARGDGIAMAYRAGANLINLEYVQFHPTALYHESAPRFLISESVRGEGARLVTRDGKEFMEKYDSRGSLAARDIVARGIHQELLESDEPCVFLDMTHKDAQWIGNRFPSITEFCLGLGIDITTEPIPVVPAAHYSCGGVATDARGQTSIRGLRAVGEVACTGLHGANRLASTSLLEALVYGHTTGKSIVEGLSQNRAMTFPPVENWVEEKEQLDPALVLQDRLTIKYTMWNYVGLVRSAKRLSRAKQILRELQDEVENFYAQSKLNDELIGLRNGVQCALAVLYGASQNRTSRGCHYRID